MNKKQLIVAGVTGIVEILLFALWPYFTDFRKPTFYPIFPIAIAILIIGGLLIYTLRNKKEQPAPK